MKKLLKNIITLIRYSFYRMACLFPIKGNLIVFQGNGYRNDNCESLYQYIKKKNKYRVIWFVKDPSLYSAEDNENTLHLNAYKLFGFKAIYYVARSKVYFSTHGRSVNFPHREGQSFVNLWHGVPIKGRTGLPDEISSDFISTGPEATPLIAKFINAPEEKFRELGYPRNDTLLNNISDGIENPFIRGKNVKKLIIWMPTFRASHSKGLSETMVDTESGLPLLFNERMLDEFNKELESINVCLLLKIHYLQQKKDVFEKFYSNIVIIKDNDLIERNLNLYEVVAKSDALLTDYSSISYDYFLLDKPIGYIVGDIAEYRESRGFITDNVDSLMPGDHINTVEDLFRFCRCVSDGQDLFRIQRHDLSNRIHRYKDARASERICDFFSL